MAILVEFASTAGILKFARFHLAALRIDPDTPHLVEGTQAAAAELAARYQASMLAEDREAEAAALMARAEFELDRTCSACEREVLTTLAQRRDSADYRATFPKGISAVLAARGEAQARLALGLVSALAQRLPVLHDRFAQKLTELAQAGVASDKKYAGALRARAQARAEERMAHQHLLCQLRRNHTALESLCAGDSRRVECFFPPIALCASSPAIPQIAPQEPG